MRICTFILALYIGFLTTQPMTARLNSCFTNKIEKKYSSSCCEMKKEKQAKKQHSTESQCPGVCNPFGQGTCCLYTAALPAFQFESYAPSSEFNSLTSTNLSSTYLADCFHPPEAA